MAETSSCPACGGPVAAAVARCPRCGAGRGAPYRRPGEVARREPSEPVRGTRVRLADVPDHDAAPPRPHASARSGAGDAPTDPDAGVFSGMISPHPASSPRERGMQIVLTALGFPLIVASFLTVGFLFVRHVSAVQRVHGSLAASVVRAPGIASPLAWLAGGALLVVVAARAIPPPVAIGWVLVQMVLLGARSFVRARIRARLELDRAARRARSA